MSILRTARQKKKGERKRNYNMSQKRR